MDYLKGVAFKNDIPHISRLDIEEIANKVLNEYRPDSLRDISAIEIEKIIENDFDLTSLQRTITPDGETLGQMHFVKTIESFFDDNGNQYEEPIDRGTIVFDIFMYENMHERYRFTAAHELGHWILHQRFYSSVDIRVLKSQCTKKSIAPSFKPRTPSEWTDWQANQFASCLLLPRNTVRMATKEYLCEKNLKWRQLVDFDLPEMRERFIELSSIISKAFEVSNDCARIRLETLLDVKYPTSKAG